MDVQEQANQKSSPQPHPKKLKILTTASVYLGNVSLGFLVNAIPPALEDIRLRFGSEIEEISVVFTVQLVIYCVGAILYGALTRFMNRQIIALATLALMAFSLYVIPHCPTQLVFLTVGGVIGFSSGIYDALQVVWIIEIWQEKSGPYILAQHLCFAIGSIIPSILIAPFLTKNDTSATPNYGNASRIYIPFTILGAITTVAMLFHAFLYTFCRYYTPPIYVCESNSLQNEQNPSEDAAVNDAEKSASTILGINTIKLKLIVVSGVFLGAYMGMEVCTLQFVPVFGQHSDLKMTESASAYVLTSLTGMFAIGRVIGVFIIFKVRPEIIIIVNIVLVAIANLILLIWANNNLTMFWIGCIILGTGYSTLYPGFCAFMEKHLVFTNAIGSFICVVGSAFAAIYPLIVGRFIKEQAVVLTYINFFSIIACISALAWGYIVVRKSKTRV